MKKILTIVLLWATVLAVGVRAEETKEQRDARMKWFREAKFGMFIHWGVYAVPAGTWNGKQIGGIGEWIMWSGKIPCADYQAFAKDFNPVKYNPEDWVRIAKDAGMKYMVITSKHHDGFALFDSKASDWNIVKATPYGKDLLKPLAAACRDQGMKLGFYYSQAQDWNNGGSTGGKRWDKAQERSMDEYIDKVAVPQVKEILSNYGEFPAVLWWDTPYMMNQERAAKLEKAVKELKPDIILNNRLGGGYYGDTETPEQFIPATGYKGRDWETCMTMNGTWGFKSYDNNWKSTSSIIQMLVDIVSKGGNYLLNVGPTAEGVFPDASIQRLKEVGAWMKVNGEAIYGTTASPFPRLPSNLRCTQKPGKLFLHVFDWPAKGELSIPLSNKIKKAYLLAAPDRLLTTTSGEAGVVVQGPAEAPDKYASVMVVEIEGRPEVVSVKIRQSSGGVFCLDAEQATLTGGLSIESASRGARNIGCWTDVKDSVEWMINCSQPGKFDVEAEMACLPGSEGSEVVLQAGKSSLTAKIAATGSWGDFKKVKLGQIEVGKGDSKVVLKANSKPGDGVVNLRCIQFIPVK